MIKKIKGIPKFFKQVREEMGKVHWSSRREIVSASLIVIVVACFLTLYIWGIDLGFSKLIQLFLG
ncbi:MAG: preprotein translocase subunit SecE [Candidatus Omnitrophica bacterium]|nr:preprotein translocase subunit SecE [Candidatus Omnitrophota bacterium]